MISKAQLLAFTLATHAPALLAVPVDAGIELQHQDLGGAAVIERGTGHDPCIDGVSSGFPCKNVEMLSRLTAGELGGTRALDSWGWKDPMTGRYYALVAMDNGTSFVDVTQPADPVFVGRMPSAPPPADRDSSSWRDVKVYSDHAFVVADGIKNHGMQVFDLARLRGVTAPEEFEADAHYNRIGDAHNIAISETSGTAVIVGADTCNGGLHLVDISDPEAPAEAGCFGADGFTHDVQCVGYRGPDPDHQQREICFASNRDSLTIVDISDKANPFMVGKSGYPNIGYAHQGWLSEDQGFFFLGDELDERDFGSNTRTVVFDVGDLDNPAYAGAYFSGSTATDHNLYVKGDYLYEANYTAGLRILRIDDPASAELHEVAYFDTYPANDQTGYAGAWNVYPFFDNGTLLVSDMNSGLFMLRADLAGSAQGLFDGGLSGAWVGEGLNDQGLALFVDENQFGPVAYFAWFLFLDGQPFWLAGSAQFEAGADEIAIPVLRLAGLEFLSPGEDTAERTELGELVIHAHGCDTIHVAYDLAEGFGAGEIVMHPVIGVQGRACTMAR